MSAAGAAFVNGTAAHGEDFDDTFEGGPVHAGAVIVPAVLAACERHNPDGRAALLGIAVGVEMMCRLSLVAPKLAHKAGFHPTAVFGAMGAAAGVGAALELDAKQIVDALGIAGSMASRHHRISRRGRLDQAHARRLGGAIGPARGAAWRAPASPARARCSRACTACSTASPTRTEGDYDALTGDFGTRWVTETLAFKPYPCGTMTHPYIDCARRLAARGIKADDIAEMVCEVGEGTVHRLWEPLAAKQRPPNGYAGKFSTPYCIAAGFVRGNVGLERFHRRGGAATRPCVALAAKVRYRIDPKNPYPNEFHRPHPRDACATAAWSRSASRTCAAARTSR